MYVKLICILSYLSIIQRIQALYTNTTLLNSYENYNRNLEFSSCNDIQDCFNCSLFYSKNQFCEWTANKCDVTTNITFSLYFYETFEDCTISSSALTTMQNYCGSLTRTIPFVSSPSNFNNGYLADNMYCRIEALNLDPTKIVQIQFTDLNPSAYNEIYLEINLYNGSTQKNAIKDLTYSKLIANVQKIIFHYYSHEKSNVSPYILDFKYSDIASTSYMALIIALVVVLVLCFGCSFFFWKCSKNIMEKNRKRAEEQIRRQLAIENRQVALTNAQIDTNLNPALLAQVEMEKKRNKIKNALKKLFEEDLKPRKYNEDNNYFHTDCTICLETFKDSSIVTTLLCKHVFHFECIKDYIKKRKIEFKCPNCNDKIIPDKLIEDSIELIQAEEINIPINHSPIQVRTNGLQPEILSLNNQNPVAFHSNNFITSEDRTIVNHLNNNENIQNEVRRNILLTTGNNIIRNTTTAQLQNNTLEEIKEEDQTNNNANLNNRTHTGNVNRRSILETRNLNLNTGAYRINQ